MHTARIKWYIPIKVGDNIYRPEENFSKPVFFKDENNEWMKSAWSIVLNQIDYNLEKSETVSKIKFLSPKAPSHLLDKGSKFKIFLGELIAEGEVIS